MWGAVSRPPCARMETEPTRRWLPWRRPSSTPTPHVAEVTASRGDESVQPAPAGEGVVTLTGVGASLGMGIGPAVLVGGEVPEPPVTPLPVVARRARGRGG